MKISVALSMILLCFPLLGQEPEAEPHPGPDLIVLGGVELCGPAAPAEEYLLGALNERYRKRHLKKRDEIKPDSNGKMNLWFNRAPVEVRFGGFLPYGVNLQIYDDQVLAVMLYFTSENRDRNIYEDALRRLTQQKGKPERVGTTSYIWIEGEKTTLLGWDIQKDRVYISSACTELLKESTAEEKKESNKNLEGVL